MTQTITRSYDTYESARIVVEQLEALNQRGETVCAVEHLLLVERRAAQESAR